MKSVITEHIDTLLKFTETNPRQSAFYRWLKENGKVFWASDRDKKKERELFSHMNRQIAIKPRQCFYNSQLTKVFLHDLGDDTQGKLEYYEGYYVSHIPIAISHGFLVFHGKQEKVVDLTSFVAGIEVNEYFGVPIPCDYIASKMVETETAGSVLARYFYEKIYPPQCAEEVIG